MSFKKFLGLILCIVLIFTATPLNVGNIIANAETDGYYTYTVSDGKATITDCDESISGEVVIPSTLGGYPVTSIDDYAFCELRSLTSIIIPDNVTSIGEYAFWESYRLTNIYLSESVINIGRCAFSACTHLENVYFRGTVEESNNIFINDFNELLTSATWHYNCCIDLGEHKYSENCGTQCNLCGYIRTEPHTYSNACDAECNICGNIRTPNAHKKIGYIITNSSSYPFTLNDGVYSSTNKTNSSTSTMTLDVLNDGKVVIDYYTSTEDYYDKLIIKHNDSIKISASGDTDWQTITINVSKGDKVYITYSKDGSEWYGNDTVYFKLSDSTIDAGEFEPTCEEAVVCDVCGETVKPALGHKFESVVTAPTCTKEGYTTHTCALCGDSYVDNTVSALGHNYKRAVTSPTCINEGYTTHICTGCGDSYIDEFTAPKEHLYSSYEIVFATCKNDGGFKFTCADCGEEHFVRTSLKLEHEFITYKNGYKCCKNCDLGKIPHPDFMSGRYANGYGWADLDNDGKIGYNDLEMLNSVVINAQFGDRSKVCRAADVNGDGIIDMKDVVRIKKILGIIPGGGVGEYTTLTDIPNFIQ